jgi:hypothetical protein
MKVRFEEMLNELCNVKMVAYTTYTSKEIQGERKTDRKFWLRIGRIEGLGQTVVLGTMYT